ncbi:restriction endonuclease subunit S [Roseateles microcysteis]|uniref:restriction endonuclease subunit S n=1 Tax=Roseateles microcysteis TaxID=3119057 RepID=UPI002FE6824F
MSSEWPLVPLEDLTDGTPITYGVVKPGEECLDGVRFVRGGDVVAGQVQISQLRTITREVSKQYSRTLLRGGELLVSLVGNPGEVALAPKSLAGANIARQVGLVRLDSGKVYPNYVQFFLRSRVGRGLLLAHSKGSVQQVINLADLKSVRVPLPPLPQQAAVANFMQDIDDRITLLRETNATLEAIAQALFKSWFVDFDPVRALAQGRAPEGMDEATAALFPDSFEDSELGKVPKGWNVQAIGNCVDTVGGATPDTKNAAFWSPAEFAWTTPKDLSGATSPALIATERKLSAAGLAKIGSGLLPAGSLLMSSRAPIGYLAITDLPVAINQGYIGMLPGGALPPLYMLRWCQVHMEQIKGRANGSTFMEISKKAFRPIPAVLPGKDVIAAYLAVAQPLFDRVIANERQALSLTEVRDTLLPRLISGQLRLPEARAITDEALA